jgi:hypothetical protein
MSQNAPSIRCACVSRNAPQIRRAGAQRNAARTVRHHELISLTSRNRRAAVAVIREELAVWQTENTGRIENAKKEALRVKAEMAFLAAGGARGDFAREWLSGFF